MAFRSISIEFVQQHVALDDTSPSGLRWTPAASAYRQGAIHAGKKQWERNAERFYWTVRLRGVDYFAHRLVWVLRNGSIADDEMVDHRDGDSLNNTEGNLRIATAALNLRNRGRMSRNKSGVVGVRFVEKGSYYKADWVELDGTHAYATFSCKPYGDEVAFAFAQEARWTALLRLQAEGAGYSERHLDLSRPAQEILEIVALMKSWKYFSAPRVRRRPLAPGEPPREKVRYFKN